MMTTDDCACLYGECEDPPEFFSRSWVRARKSHACCECRQPILVGEMHESYSGKWDGKVETYRTCAACQDIRESLNCGDWSFTTLWDDVRDQIFNETGLTIACVNKLTTVVAKRKLQAAWMEFVKERGG